MAESLHQVRHAQHAASWFEALCSAPTIIDPWPLTHSRSIACPASPPPLLQIANVAFMETHLPPSDDNPLKQDGKKDTGTLWDQERDELAVRILLEEGKLNLALRILHRYRTALRDSEKFTATVKTTSEKFNSDVVTVSERCKVFEQSVGILLKFAFSHVEALQIMDLPEFVQHCAEVIAEAEQSTRVATPLELDKLQETLVLHYLSSLGQRMEDMADEDRVMDLIQDHALMPAFISHLAKHYTWYKIDALEGALRFLNGCMASESYQSERSKFIADKKTMSELVSIKALFLTELIAAPSVTATSSASSAAASSTSSASTAPLSSLRKKDIQHLLDEIARFERQPGLVGVVKETVPLRERIERYRVAEIKEKEKINAAAATAATAAAAAIGAAATTAGTPAKPAPAKK